MRALQRNGYKVISIAREDGFGKHIKNAGIPFINLKQLVTRIEPILDLLLFIRLFFLYRQIKPNLVFQYSVKPNVYGSFVSYFLNIPTISMVAGIGHPFHRKNLLYHIVSFLYRTSLKQSQEVWFLNQHDLDFFVSNKLVSVSKTKLLPGEGVNVN